MKYLLLKRDLLTLNDSTLPGGSIQFHKSMDSTGICQLQMTRLSVMKTHTIVEVDTFLLWCNISKCSGLMPYYSFGPVIRWLNILCQFCQGTIKHGTLKQTALISYIHICKIWIWIWCTSMQQMSSSLWPSHCKIILSNIPLVKISDYMNIKSHIYSRPI